MIGHQAASRFGWKHVLAAIGAVLVASAQVLAGQGAPTTTPAVAQEGPTLALSMDEAVAMALETSLGLKSERISVNIASLGIASARAAFLPQVSSTVSRQINQNAPLVLEDGTTVPSSSSALNGNARFNQTLPWFGGSYSASWLANRNSTSGQNSTFNPRLGSTFSASFTQPLWRNFRIDNNRANLQTSQRQNVIADMQLQRQIVATEVSVRTAYLSLVAAIQGRSVAQQNMDLAEQSLKNAQARVAVGQSPQIDTITAEVSVEGSRESLIVATAGIARAEDALRGQILDPGRPDYWQVRLVPTETNPQLARREIDVDAAIQNALANRLDLAVVKRQMEITDLSLAVSRNATKPGVDFNLGYTASGAGGTQFVNGAPLVRGFGPVLGDAFGGAFPSWTTGVTVSYPLGRSGAEASFARAQLQKQQEQLDLRLLELAIVGAVRQAARDVETSYQRVQAAQKARDASERQLDAEERKFAVGMSDTFRLQQQQQDLANRRTQELNAIISYSNALTAFDRVQKIP